MIEKAPNVELIPEMQENMLSIILPNGIYSFSDSIKRIENEYLYWDKIKYLKDNRIHHLTSNNAKSQEVLWSITKIRRSMIQKKDFISGILIEYNINEYLQQKLHYLDFNFGAGLQKEQLLTDLDKQQYLDEALMEESIFSSRIEGAVTTRVAAKEMLRKNKKPKNKSERMILNNYKTIQYISDHQNEDISLEKLYEIHRLVTKGTLEEKEVGVFRMTNDVNVVNKLTGEIVHRPPSFKELPDLMNSFCNFFNHNPKEDFIHPIVKGSILHFLMGYIHPFTDGNGRTARAIFYWYLLKNGYWLTEYLSVSRIIMKTKARYEKAYLYTEIDEMDVTYFIHYQVKVLIRAFEALKDYVAKKKKEQTKLLKYLRKGDINERQATVLQKLEEDKNRFFTVKEVENTFGITNQTARTDMEELVEKGFLKKIPVDKKSFSYWKGERFDKTFL